MLSGVSTSTASVISSITSGGSTFVCSVVKSNFAKVSCLEQVVVPFLVPKLSSRLARSRDPVPRFGPRHNKEKLAPKECPYVRYL